MENPHHIPLTHLCSLYEIEYDVLVALYENELIEIVEYNNEKCIPVKALPKTEKFIRLYAELNINPEGIVVVTQLLEKVEQLHTEIITLRNKLTRYE
ncbi:chaperone modulator CbpM [Arenibacter sp. GZD96]|uniref:chaperone modulator CbpM n=1 Tax=Aurantibrevibacter litoralis TaxID=3106030 RepID=UPI002B0010EC|nr:chaperone modulator CbpM [Arenibacter sp. GZD-96]MEA1785181.1 chaperone modulator CbpM [Arenibacter sp. GZD-96]